MLNQFERKPGQGKQISPLSELTHKHNHFKYVYVEPIRTETRKIRKKKSLVWNVCSRQRGLSGVFFASLKKKSVGGADKSFVCANKNFRRWKVSNTRTETMTSEKI